MYKTHFNRYTYYRERYIESVHLDSKSAPTELLSQMKQALEDCLEVATLTQTLELSQQQLAFANHYFQQCLARQATSKGPPPGKLTDFMLYDFLNESALRIISQGFSMRMNSALEDTATSIDTPHLLTRLLQDWQSAVIAFTHSHIHFATAFKALLTWPSITQAYQVSLDFIQEYLNYVETSPYKANIDSARLEKLFIDHSTDICRLAIHNQDLDTARSFMTSLLNLLQHIPNGYREVRTQCQALAAGLLPFAAAIDSDEVIAPITNPKKSEENRRKKESQRLAQWTKEVDLLSLEPASITRLTDIRARLDSKTTERPSLQQKINTLLQRINQKLTAIEEHKTSAAATAFEADHQPSPPSPIFDRALGALQLTTPTQVSIQPCLNGYHSAYQHHQRGLLAEIRDGKPYQGALAILDISLGKCLNLSRVPPDEALAIYLPIITFLQDFAPDKLPTASPAILIDCQLALGQIAIQRGWQLFDAAQRCASLDDSQLHNLFTTLEAILQQLVDTLADHADVDNLLAQHRQRLTTVPRFLSSRFYQPNLAVITSAVMPEPEIHQKSVGLVPAVPEVAKNTSSAKKLALKAARQQKLDALSQIQTQIQALPEEQTDSLQSLTQLAAELTCQRQTQSNPTVLKSLTEIEKILAEKRTRIMAFQPAERVATLSELHEDVALSDSDNSGNISCESFDTQEKATHATSDFITLPLGPKCLEQPLYAFVIDGLKQISQAIDKDLYLFGSAIYKAQPNDLDWLIHDQDAAAVIEALAAQGATISPAFQKPNRHVIPVEWHGVKMDINLSHKAWHQHARQLDFTIGAAYFNVRTQQTTTIHPDSLTHIHHKELHCAQPGGSLAMLQQDPSILFRAMHLERLEGYLWSDEFKTAVDTLASLPANPFMSMKPGRLYQEMGRLFAYGQAQANLNRLLQLNVFEKLFVGANSSWSTKAEKNKAYAIIQRAAIACDTTPQTPSFMYYAIHWAQLSQNPVPNCQFVSNQSLPYIPLQKGIFPLWNQCTHDYNCQLLERYASEYDQAMAQTSSRSTSRSFLQNPKHYVDRPPCHTSARQGHAFKKPNPGSAGGAKSMSHQTFNAALKKESTL